MQLSKRIILIILFALGMLWGEGERKATNFYYYGTSDHNYLKKLGAEDDTPSLPLISWIGVGRLGKVTVTNTGDNGYYERPAGWPGYDGTQVSGFGTGNGNTGEFPQGANQHYIWDAGIWIGGLFPSEKDAEGNPLQFEKRTAIGAYYSENDLVGLSPLYQSDQIFPESDANAGLKRFKQFGVPAETYQELWPYADTTVNSRREPYILNDGQLVNPDNGDFISDQDTYCVFGDYFPVEDVIFAGTLNDYDGKPLGIRVEQRTYSFLADAYVFFNYYITNMNQNDTLYDVHFGYFMDNDIGDATDDLIGFDEVLNMGYSFDSDLTENGWTTSAGYIGTALMRTPLGPDGEELGLTGFQTWENGGDESPEGQGKDNAKYDQLAKGGFETFDSPDDVRQLMTSGPIAKLAPNETVEVTIVVVAGESLANLRANTESAYERYQIGYIAPAPPLPPNVTYTPADERIILSWSNDPSETTPDPQTGEEDFAGYRIYISDDDGVTWGEASDSYPSGWVPVADFDISTDSHPRYISTVYQLGTSNAKISAVGLATQVADFSSGSDPFKVNRYALEFTTDTTMFLYNLSQSQIVDYNASYFSDLSATTGWVVTDSVPSSATLPVAVGTLDISSEAQYLSGGYIWVDGAVVQIINDSSKVDELGNPVDVKPLEGDVFIIETFESSAIGPDNGLQYHYQITSYGSPAEDLRNGFPYRVAVTAYDKGDPSTGLPSFETAPIASSQSIYPRSLPTGFLEESLTTVDQTLGISPETGNTLESDGSISVSIWNPLSVQDGDYTIRFFGDDTTYFRAEYAEVSFNSMPIVTDEVDLDSVALVNGDFSFTGLSGLDGLNISASSPHQVAIDEDNTGWNRFISYDFNVNTQAFVEPYNYRITFHEDIPDDVTSYSGDTLVFPVGDFQVPFKVENTTLGTKPALMVLPFLDVEAEWNYTEDGIRDGVTFLILNSSGTLGQSAFVLSLDYGDSVVAPRAGDVFEFRTLKPFRNGETYNFSTRSFGKFINSEYDLSDVKVVPNPYYVRADWDPNKFNRRVQFTNLPNNCTLKIFTVAGLHVRTIEHDGSEEDQNNSGAGFQSWNLRDKNDLDVPSGMYLFQVKDNNTGKDYVGKFALIM
jgi:hypothetical protein